MRAIGQRLERIEITYPILKLSVLHRKLKMEAIYPHGKIIFQRQIREAVLLLSASHIKEKGNSWEKR